MVAISNISILYLVTGGYNKDITGKSDVYKAINLLPDSELTIGFKSVLYTISFSTMGHSIVSNYSVSFNLKSSISASMLITQVPGRSKTWLIFN